MGICFILQANLVLRTDCVKHFLPIDILRSLTEGVREYLTLERAPKRLILQRGGMRGCGALPERVRSLRERKETP